MDFKKTAEEILISVGGKNNVSHVTHCITRLRFTLKDESKVNKNKIKNIEGVIGLVEKGGQCQVVIGNEVENVYKELISIPGFDKTNENNDNKGEKKKFKLYDIFDFIAGLFTPILPVLTAAGMIQAILVAGVALKWIDNTSSTYYVLSKVADAGFYFLPVMLAYTTATKFKCNQYLAVMLAGVFLHPALAAGGYPKTFSQLTFLGIGITPVKYASSVLPIILTVILMSYIEKIADKISPTSVKFFTKPLITILICAPIALIAVGPLGFTIGQYVAQGINFLGTNVGFLSVAIMGACYPLFVMTGMHHAYAPIALASIASLGYEGVMSPAGLCANIAQGGAALAIFIKTRDKKLKALAGPAGFSCLLGVSEPVMYGVTLKYKTALISTMIGGGIAGLFAGTFGVKSIAMASPGLAALPVFMGPTFMYALVTIAIAFSVGFIVSFVLFKNNVEEQKNELSEVYVDTIEVKSPVEGSLVDLSKVNDETFSSGMLGKGIAIEPATGKFVSPVDGEITACLPTGHAYGITTKEGLELLIHLGINTVELNGDGFISKVKIGDKVQVGTIIAEVDLDKVKKSGYDMTTIVVVTNSDNYKEIYGNKTGSVETQDVILSIR